MAKTKKIIVTENDAPAVEVEREPEVESPIVNETHHVHRKWVRAVPLDEIDIEEDDESDEDEEPEAEAAPVELDPIERVIKEMAVSTASWTVLVERLPRYSIDGQTGPRSRKYCGALNASDPDYLSERRYREDIQRLWARANTPNDFYLSVRKNGKVYCYLGVDSVEPPIVDAPSSNGGAPGLPSPMMAAPMNGSDPAKMMRENMRMTAEMINTFKEFIVPAQPAPQQNPPLTPESALVTLLASDENVIQQVSGGLMRRLGLGGDGGGVDSFWGFVSNMLSQPEIAKGVGMLLQGVASAVAAPAQQAQPQQGQLIPQPAPQQPQAPPAPATADPAQVSAFEAQMWGFIMQCFDQQPDPAAAAAQIGEFLRIHPELDVEGGSFDNFLNREPRDVIADLARNPQTAPIASRPGLVEWIANFQRIASEEESEAPVIEVKPEVVH